MFLQFLCIILLNVGCARKFSGERSIVFGPGLNPSVVLPARYFYIQAVDTNGKNYTVSPGKNFFQVKFHENNGRRVRVQVQVLDRNDGSFIVRYRLYDSYADLKFDVKHKDKHVASSPYLLKGMVYHEKCYCSENNHEKWLDEMKCPTDFKQIDKDFEKFPEIDFNKVLSKVLEIYGTNNAICHYSVIDNEVYRKCYGEHVGFAMFMDAWLLSLARKVRLPNMEFISNLGDWPLSTDKKNPLPIISWCGSSDTNDIVQPTYDLTESTLETMGRVSLDMMNVQGNTGPKWKKKIAKGFFRGRDSRQERLDLTIHGRKNTDLFDIAMTNFFFFPYDEKLYGPKNQHISFFEFFKYKYQLNIDGTVAAYRFPYLLVGDAVVFKQESHYYEHFYTELESMKHYIPLKRDLSDVKDKIQWAIENDAKVHKIGKTGQQYARDNLMGDKLFCYSFKMFQKYASRLVSRPQKRDGQEHIKQPSGREASCDCKRKPVKTKRDEL